MQWLVCVEEDGTHRKVRVQSDGAMATVCALMERPIMVQSVHARAVVVYDSANHMRATPNSVATRLSFAKGVPMPAVLCGNVIFACRDDNGAITGFDDDACAVVSSICETLRCAAEREEMEAKIGSPLCADNGGEQRPSKRPRRCEREEGELSSEEKDAASSATHIDGGVDATSQNAPHRISESSTSVSTYSSSTEEDDDDDAVSILMEGDAYNHDLLFVPEIPGADVEYDGASLALPLPLSARVTAVDGDNETFTITFNPSHAERFLQVLTDAGVKNPQHPEMHMDDMSLIVGQREDHPRDGLGGVLSGMSVSGLVRLCTAENDQGGRSAGTVCTVHQCVVSGGER